MGKANLRDYTPSPRVMGKTILGDDIVRSYTERVCEIVDTYDAIGIREDLSDIIYNISPTDTPFMSTAKRGTAENVLFEWQTDALATAANNKQIDGDDAAGDALTATARLPGRTQISRKVIIISGTEEAVRKAGRKSEIAYQIAKAGKELKRDMEFALTRNTVAATGSATVARETDGLEGWVMTNDSLGTGGTSPTAPTSAAPNGVAPVDGTARAFTESLLKTVVLNCFTEGGNPTMLMVGPFNKQTVSSFTGNATRFDKSEDKRLISSLDYYVTDFGELHVVPNRFQRERTAWVLDMDYWSVHYLRNFRTEELSKTGDNEKRMLLVEYGLCAKNEKASGAVRDLTTT